MSNADTQGDNLTTTLTASSVNSDAAAQVLSANQSNATTPRANDGEGGDPNSIEAPPFDLAEPFDMTFNARGRSGKVKVRHILRRATLRDLMERDQAQPYRTRMLNDDVEEPVPDLDNKADIKLYDKLVVKTFGYRVNVEPDQSQDDRKSALAAIPGQHKKDIISAITPVNTDYVPEALPESADGDEVFVYGEGLTYKFVSTFGFNDQFKATVVMREPNDAQLSKFKGSTKFAIDKTTQRRPVTEMRVDLKPAVEIFDSLVESIDGFIVSGSAFELSNKLHLALVDPYLKRSVLNALVKQTQLDLGN